MKIITDTDMILNNAKNFTFFGIVQHQYCKNLFFLMLAPSRSWLHDIYFHEVSMAPPFNSSRSLEIFLREPRPLALTTRLLDGNLSVTSSHRFFLRKWKTTGMMFSSLSKVSGRIIFFVIELSCYQCVHISCGSSFSFGSTRKFLRSFRFFLL
jgi:hypothetical protein